MDIYCEVCERNIKKSNWETFENQKARTWVQMWLKKLRKNNVGNAGSIRDWKCLGKIMLLVMDALLIGKSGQEIIQKK